MRLDVRKIIKETLQAEQERIDKKVATKQKIVNKLGVSEEIADWAFELNPKLPFWVVDTLKKKHKQEMEGRNDKETLDEYYQTLTTGYQDFFDLVKETNRPPINPKQLSYDEAIDLVNNYSHIRQWVENPNTDYVDLKRLTWDEALETAERWHEGLVPTKVYNINKNSEIIPGSKAMGSGYYWALTKSNYSEESRHAMGHCGTANKRDQWLLHLRKEEEEFITADWHPTEKFVIQFKGKQNTRPKKEYHKYIYWLLKNFDIEKLRTLDGFSPMTNFQLGDLEPEKAVEIFYGKPGIVTDRDVIRMNHFY
jgi:hypothetical protein